MSFKSIFLGFMIVNAGVVFAQASKDESAFSGNFQANQHEANKKVLEKSVEVIGKRVAEFEKLYEQLSKNPPKTKLKSIQSAKDKVIVLNEDLPLDHEGQQIVNHLKYIQYEFAGNKVKSIKLIYEKKNFFETVHNSTKTFTIDPASIDNSTIEEATPAVTEKSSYKDFSAETKFKTLKTVEKQLLNSIYKIEILLRHNVIDTDLKATSQLQGI